MVKASDVQNAHLTAPCAEQIWTRLGPKFGQDQQKEASIVCALYGLNLAVASFFKTLGQLHGESRIQAIRAYSDLWMKPIVQFEYYAYMLLYVDDCLSIHCDAETVLWQIDKYFPMKARSIGDCPQYLPGIEIMQSDYGMVSQHGH